MPNSVSARKRLRQNVRHRNRNRAVRSEVRTHIRKVRKAVEAGDATTSEAEFRQAVKELDQAAAARVIHPNAAARTKSRLSKAIKAIKA